MATSAADLAAAEVRRNEERSRARRCAPRTGARRGAAPRVSGGHRYESSRLFLVPSHQGGALHGNHGREEAAGEIGWIFVTEEQVR